MRPERRRCFAPSSTRPSTNRRVAGELGRALGYADKGLVNSLAGWSEVKRPTDFDVIDGEDLRVFKGMMRLVSGAGTSRAASITVLFETGMDLACQKAQTPAGERLRRYLAEEVLPKLRRGEAPMPVAAPVAPPVGPSAIEAKLDRLLDAFGQMAGMMTAMLQPGAPSVRPQLPSGPPMQPPITLIPLDWLDANSIALLLSDRLRTPKAIDALPLGGLRHAPPPHTQICVEPPVQ